MKINGATTVHGIMGNPVSHSLSPAMHNAAFAALGANGVYVPFPVEDVAGAMTGFKALGVRGISVTIPHKQAVIEYLDDIDPLAEKIGAVNTLVLNDGRVKGYNTDWLGANRALEDEMTLSGASVLLLGAGGSARAIGFGLLEAGAQVTIASRTPQPGQALAKVLDCPWHPLLDIPQLKADAVVNATSVGMGKMADMSLVSRDKVADFPVVMDIVYAPLETRLLKEATKARCRTIDGLKMLLYQGVAQFELWTGEPAPLAVMDRELKAGLGL
ncbi:MAG: shikimate dehydrogenase [Thermodesulfobacteriota bacterium]